MPRPEPPDPTRPESPLDLRALAPPFPPSRTMTGGEVTPNEDELRGMAAQGGRRAVRDPGSPPVALIAWLVTIALVAFVFGSSNQSDLHHIAPSLVGAPEEPAADPLAPPDLQSTLMGRYMVGAGRMLSAMQPAAAEQLADQFTGVANDLARSDPLALVRAAIVQGELVGADAALETLDRAAAAINDWASLEPERDAPAITMLEDVTALRALYTRGPGAIPDAQRDQLTQRYEWFARLAFSHGLDDADPARAAPLASASRTAATFIVAIIVVAIAFLTGIALCIAALVLRARGKLRPRYAPAAPGGSVYIEVFALFLVGFLAISFASASIEQATGRDLMPALIWFLLLTPVWALLRGAPIRNWRFALGWHTGNGALREVAAGVVGYLAGLPIVALGIGCTLLFMSISGLFLPADEARAPTHPVVDQIAAGGAGAIVAIYILACVWAPIVEETVFRGALYHHMRARMIAPVSGIIVGFIFAAIHPQGWVAIPALMSLAIVFAFLREWRGSLIAPITAHALNNAFVITMLIVAIT